MIDPREETERQKRLKHGYKEVEQPRRETRQTGSIGGGGGAAANSPFEWVLLTSLAGDGDYDMRGRLVTVDDADAGTFTVADSDETFYAWPWIPRSYYTYLVCATPEAPPDSANVLMTMTKGGKRYVFQSIKIDFLDTSQITTRSGCGI
jgi:hypothetical protein